MISNLTVNGGLSRCLSYDKYVDEQGDFLSMTLDQTQYSVTINICHSLFHKITYYEQPVLFAFMNCNLNYYLKIVHFQRYNYARVKMVHHIKQFHHR